MRRSCLRLANVKVCLGMFSNIAAVNVPFNNWSVRC